MPQLTNSQLAADAAEGDQKDVFKPQAVVSVKWILFETPE